MATDEEIANDFAQRLLVWMRKEIGVDDDFMSGTEDDWTLVVKLHAMLETGLNGVLVRELKKPELDSVIAKLPTSDPRIGKVAFAKAMNIIPTDSATFLQKLSELRNHCVHDVRNFRFDLKKHIAALKEEDRKGLLKIMKKQIAENFVVDGLSISRDEFLRASPRGALVIGTMNIMLCLHTRHMLCEVREVEAENQRLRAERDRAHEQSTAKES